MLYFKKDDHEPTPETDISQFETLQAFKSELLTKQPLAERPLIWEYQDSSTLALEVQKNVRKVIFEQLWHTPDIGTPSLGYSFSIEPVLLRAEGITELIGNGYLTCKYNSPNPPETRLWFSVVLFFTTLVTSRIDTAHSGHDLGDPFLMEVGRPGSEACFVRGVVSFNEVAFGRVYLDGIKPFEARVFQIGNIRCNAFAVGGGSHLQDVKLIGVISTSGAHVENDTPFVGTVRKGIEVEVRSWDSATPMGDPSVVSAQYSGLSRVATLRFSEGFPGAFKSRPLAHQMSYSFEGHTVYESEDYIGPTPRFLDSRESVNSCTRLRAVFHTIPRGVRLYVPVQSVWPSPLEAQLVDSESTLVSPESTDIDLIRLKELDSSENHSSIAVWEVTRSNWQRERTAGFLDFPVYASVEREAMLGTVLVNAGFAPTSIVTIVSPSAPIPRFLDTSSVMTLLRVGP